MSEQERILHSMTFGTDYASKQDTNSEAYKAAAAQRDEIKEKFGFAGGGIVDIDVGMDMSRSSNEGLESFLNRDRRSATLRKNMQALQQQAMQQQQQPQQPGPQPTAPGPQNTMQQGIMPMAQG